jgi:hypothetical protein
VIVTVARWRSSGWRRWSTAAELLLQFVELVPDHLPPDVLLAGIVRGDALVGVPEGHEVARHLADALVDGVVGSEVVQVAGIGFDGIAEGGDLVHLGGQGGEDGPLPGTDLGQLGLGCAVER